MTARLAPTQLLRYAGLFTWLCIGIPLVLNNWYFQEGGLSRDDIIGWRVSYLLFGICYWLLTRAIGRKQARPFDHALLLVSTVSAVAVTHFSGTGLGGTLLMVISGALPWFLPLRFGIVWLIVQHMALVPVFATLPELEFTVVEAVLQGAFFVGYSSFAFITSLVAKQQAEARDEQRRLNSELRATRALLAESTRLTERMRISRELHDLLGHHLTALSLNLEVAAHLSSGKSQEHVRQAQSLAKLLLTDVRDAVSQLREDDTLDLTEALSQLVDGVPALEIQLDVPPMLGIDDAGRAQVVLRCAQEIITNTVRHAGASRLWLSVKPVPGGIAIRARDDGHGIDTPVVGNGLRGMRERLAQFGGTLEIESARGRGFALNAWLPLGEPAVAGGT